MIKRIVKKCDIMSQEATELRSAWSYPIFERGKEYRLTAKLYRSKMVIKDKRGNKIAVNKRSKAIMIERRGKVEWIGEVPGI
jgi:hypothetical protein